MKKISFFILLSVLCACSPQKPPLDETQVVNGRSIVIPPEFEMTPNNSLNKK